MSSETKRWGTRPFWGLSFDYDPQWFLTEEHKEIQKRLIDLCRTTLRPNAVSFKFSPGFMSLDCNPNVFKLQNFVGRNFNNDLTYHGTKSNFSECFFSELELHSTWRDLTNKSGINHFFYSSYIERYPRFPRIQICKSCKFK